ncbi:MAG TPA: HAD-IA family hydrolase [bacterium]|nr:HAD-IA family hydrolase [bacterium]
MDDRPQLILFDMVGVLVRMRGSKQILTWIEGRMTPAELWQWWVNSPAIVAFETGRMSGEEFAEYVVHELQLPIEPALWLAKIVDWFDGPFPETRETLTALHGRFPLAILSNTNALFYEKLRTMDLLPFFGRTFFSHLTGLLKPDPDAFLQVVEHTGIPAEKILFFDDTEENIRTARELGFRAHHTHGMGDVRDVLTELRLL